MRRSVGAVLLAVLVAPPPAAAQSGLPDAVELPEALAAVLRGYETAWSARDPVALADLFTPDGFVMRPGAPPAVGREAIEAAYQGSGGPLALRAYAFAVDGDVGYILGGYSSTPDRPEVGKFVLALRRSPGGRWLIAADIDNGN